MNFLFLTNYFPPEGFAGSIRAYNYAKHFPEFGFYPFIITSFPSKRFPKDNSLLEEIKEFKIFRVKNISPSLIPFKNIKKGGREFKRFLRPFFEKSLSVLNKEKIDFIFVTLPPFSLLKVAISLKLRKKIPLVCEIRDPADFESGKKFIKFIKNCENLIDLFIGSHEYVLKSFGIKGKVIYAGYYEFETKKHKGFNIIYTGSMRNASLSFKRFLKFTERIDYKLYLIGTEIKVNDKKVIKEGYIEYKNLKKYFEISDLFIIFRDKDMRNYIPLKFFEQAGSEVPFLAYFKEKSNFFNFLKKLNKGEGFMWGEEENMLLYIENVKNRKVRVSFFGKKWRDRVKEICEVINEEIFNRNYGKF